MAQTDRTAVVRSVLGALGKISNKEQHAVLGMVQVGIVTGTPDFRRAFVRAVTQIDKLDPEDAADVLKSVAAFVGAGK